VRASKFLGVVGTERLSFFGRIGIIGFRAALGSSMHIGAWNRIRVLVKRQRLFITGRVQGVGFRPAVYRLASHLGLSGFVYNDTKGVTVELQGPSEKLAEFVRRLRGGDRPPLAEIRTCRATDISVIAGEARFRIERSDSGGTALAEVSPDTAVCCDCLAEMMNSSDFRYRYPFINCTNCGPRYSIVKSIPYDRPNTTMSVFAMCDRCSAQYDNIGDRRFHAQPVACGMCGPRIWLADAGGKAIVTGTDQTVAEAARLLSDGRIAAIKGIGGFHLAVNALDEEAVRRLRERKRRDHKPFAMMADSIAKIKRYAVVSKPAEAVLESPQSPIVLLPKKTHAAIAPSVAEGVDTFGFMLCYAPLHFLLFAEGLDVLVMTSGNISDEPLICDNDEAVEKLGDVADVFLMHDRRIYRRVDDSIIHFIDGEPVPLRRARGYVPMPLTMEVSSRHDVFAAGADMKNSFCIVKGNQLICSEHIGDLEDAEIYDQYVDSVQHLAKLFEAKPETVVCDLHPGYLSTRYAFSTGARDVIQVQHHWAHIASVLAEHSLAGPVIGLECDGTGYGTDGKVWGCECMISTLSDFSRFGHLRYYLLAGADKASKEAIRPVLGLLLDTYGEDLELRKFGWLLDRIEPEVQRQEIILEQLNKGVNTVETSSLGRVFDAVAAMAGLGCYNHFEAQLPMALEAVAGANIEDYYDFAVSAPGGEPLQLDLRIMIEELVGDIRAETAVEVISAKFHNCLVRGLAELAGKARAKTGLGTVALSGGVFCNRYLTNHLIKLLRQEGFTVLFNRFVPSNDGGIALGQAAIGAHLAAARPMQEA